MALRSASAIAATAGPTATFVSSFMFACARAGVYIYIYIYVCVCKKDACPVQLFGACAFERDIRAGTEMFLKDS